MSNQSRQKTSGTCQTFCWAIGLAVGGYLSFVLVTDYKQDMIQSGVLGIVAFLVVGLLARRLLCRRARNELRQRMDAASAQTQKSEQRSARVAEHAEARSMASSAAHADGSQGEDKVEAPSPKPAPSPRVEEVADVVDEPTPVEPTPEPATENAGFVVMDEAEAGGADDLKMINGINRKTERLLNDGGIFHYHQLAAATAEQLAWFDDNLPNADGLATKRNWDQQAKALAAGGETRYSKRMKAQAAAKAAEATAAEAE